MKTKITFHALAIAVIALVAGSVHAQCGVFPLTGNEVYNTVLQTASDGEPQFAQLSIFNQFTAAITVTTTVTRHVGSFDSCDLVNNTNPTPFCPLEIVTVPPGQYATQLLDLTQHPFWNYQIQVVASSGVAPWIPPVVEMELVHFDVSDQSVLKTAHYQLKRRSCL